MNHMLCDLTVYFPGGDMNHMLCDLTVFNIVAVEV